MAEIRIGTSGYQYSHWKTLFYPKDLPTDKWFAYYADHFDTVEINNTFYNLPTPKTFDAWRERAPQNFRYILKYSRYGTHMKKLKEPERVLDTFLEAAEHLKSFLGPILVQLPPGWNVNVDRLKGFLEAAPNQHRWAVEFRDESWLTQDVYEVLREHNAALCFHDMIDNHPREVTADWVYLRFHGKNYGGNYSHQKLSAVSDEIAGHHFEGRDVYAFFNNDLGGHAVHNARDLKKYVLKRIG